MKPECLITEAALSHFTVPTDVPEGDGSFCWKSTTMCSSTAVAAGRAPLVTPMPAQGPVL
jgi:hypothetical protein